MIFSGIWGYLSHWFHPLPLFPCANGLLMFLRVLRGILLMTIIWRNIYFFLAVVQSEHTWESRGRRWHWFGNSVFLMNMDSQWSSCMRYSAQLMLHVMTGAMIQKISLQGGRPKPRGVIVSRTVRMLWFPDSVFALLPFVSSKSLWANEHFEMDSHHSWLRQILFLKNT